MSHTRTAGLSPRRPGAPWRPLTAVLAALALGCSADEPAGAEDAIDREVFIATYVDLRIAALDAETRQLTDEARDEVLAKHAVTEERLMEFADVYGRDVDFMTEVWNEVEVRLDAARPGDDAAQR